MTKAITLGDLASMPGEPVLLSTTPRSVAIGLLAYVQLHGWKLELGIHSVTYTVENIEDVQIDLLQLRFSDYAVRFLRRSPLGPMRWIQQTMRKNTQLLSLLLMRSTQHVRNDTKPTVVLAISLEKKSQFNGRSTKSTKESSFILTVKMWRAFAFQLLSIVQTSCEKLK